jgi:hypothetical protein
MTAAPIFAVHHVDIDAANLLLTYFAFSPECTGFRVVGVRMWAESSVSLVRRYNCLFSPNQFNWEGQ